MIFSDYTTLLHCAIFMAVSRLSPVRIHTVTPAFFSETIVSCTSAYNLSSIPVAPRNSNSYSISSISAFVSFSLVSPSKF